MNLHNHATSSRANCRPLLCEDESPLRRVGDVGSHSRFWFRRFVLIPPWHAGDHRRDAGPELCHWSECDKCACLGFSTPSLWVAMVKSTPKEVTGTMGGIQNFGGNLAGIVVSILTGYTLEVTKSFFYALVADAAVALLGAVAAFVLIRSRKN